MPQRGSREALTTQIADSEARLHALMMGMAPSMVVPADLTLRQVQVLGLVRATPDTTGQALAQALGVSTPTISGLVDRVVAKGWVERRPDEQDRRRVLLRLTPDGEAVLIGLEAPGLRMRTALMGRLDEPELEGLAHLLRRLEQVAGELAHEHTDRG